MDTGATQTYLPGSGQPAGFYVAYNTHFSCRNTARPGYVYISVYSDAADTRNFMMRDNFALKLDGSGLVERWTQYFGCCESLGWASINPPQVPRTSRATVSPTGDRMIFSTDWGVATSGITIYDYLVRMPLSGAPTCTATTLSMAGVTNQGGAAYLIPAVAAPAYGTPADVSVGATTSLLRLFEGSTELGPAHSLVSAIQAPGNGRFVHWSSDGQATQEIYWSASDNTNPTTNGRTYSYTTGCTPGVALTAPLLTRISR